MKIRISTIVILTAVVFTSCKETSEKIKSAEETTNESNIKTKNEVMLLTGSWVQPNPINEKEVQGFNLQTDGTAESINMATLVYKKWWYENRKLTLIAESIGSGSSSVDTTIYEIVKITDKDLELKNGDYTDKYIKQ